MKKITAILVAICMTFTLLPLGGEAALGKVKTPELKKIKVRGHVITIGGVMSEGVANDSLKEAKAMVLEYAEALYDSVVNEKSYYCDAVWKEIHDAYNNALAAIENAKSIKELYYTDGWFLYLEQEIGEELEIMEALSEYIKHYAKNSGDLAIAKKSFKKAITVMRNNLIRSSYNDFYWGKLQNLFYDMDEKLKKVKTFRDYILFVSEISDVLEGVSLSDFDDEVEIVEEDGGILISLFDEEDEEEFFIVFGEEEGEKIYDKIGVEAARLSAIAKLKLYVTNRLAQAKYKGDKKALNKEIDSFKKKVLDKVEDVEAIYEAGDKKLAELIKKTGVDCPDITKPGFIKAAKEYNALTNDYNEFSYSAAQWLKVEMLFMAAKSTIENAQKEYEVYGVIDKLKKDLKKIPKADKEFTSIKSAAEKKLKKYMLGANKKKYNQPKVKTVVKKGIAAMAKVEKYEVTDLLLVRNLYVHKAEKCINKYRITTSKKGKGVITKSKTVAYGGKCTITVTPKAGYKIKKVLLNGKKTKLKNKYVFKNVKKRQRIKAVFGK